MNISDLDASLLEVRKATIEDYEAVMNIPEDHFDGYDYLPYYYKKLMEEPERSGVVVLYKDEVVGFVSARFTDQPKLASSSSARIHPDYIGIGFYRDFFLPRTENMLRSLNKEGLEVIIGSTTFFSNPKHALSPRSSELCHFYRLSFTSAHGYQERNSHFQEKISSNTDLHDIIKLDQTLSQNLLTSLDPSLFFRNGCLQVNSWAPFLASEIGRMLDYWDITVHAKYNSENTKECESFSTGIGYPTKAGFVLQVFVYFNSKYSKSSHDYAMDIVRHFYRQLGAQRSMTHYWLSNDFMTILASPVKFDKKTVSKTLCPTLGMTLRTTGYGSVDLKMTRTKTITESKL